MNKEDKLRIKELKKQKKYNEIYAEFGQKAYLKYVPSKEKRAVLRKLKKERGYEDIYNIFGEEEYNKILAKAMYNDIKEAKGTPKALLWRLGHALKLASAETLLIAATASTTLAVASDKEIKDNSIKYENEIEAYNQKINDYAKTVQNMNLSDTQIFMKVMDDMWSEMQGYKAPEKDIYGFYELDVATPEGYGVCRNYASDVAKKLNAINPAYNARTMKVYMGDNERYTIANIDRNIIESNETVREKDNEMNLSNDEINELTEVIGNHAVTFVDVPEDNLIIVLDPTNPGIGIYKDGKIYMQNSRLENGTDFEAKEVVNAFFSGERGGMEHTIYTYLASFKDSKLTAEEIEAKYGIEAQNRALEEVRQMSASEQDKFREEYKVDVEQIDRAIDEIEEERKLQNNITNIKREERE